MLSDDDFQDFIKSQLPKDEKILYVTINKRSSSSRISEVTQGCVALFIFIFAVLLLHPDKGSHIMTITERLLVGTAVFSFGAITFLIYCFFLFRKSDRRVCVFTDRRIVMFDFNKPLRQLTGDALIGSQHFRQRDISLDLIKLANPIGQKDGAGVLVLEVYDSLKKTTWYKTQIEVGNIESTKIALPKDVLLLYPADKSAVNEIDTSGS